jgi:hypothetical protein
MRSITSNRSVGKVIGVVAVIGHLLAAFLYIVFPGLEVPYPALYVFQAAWVIVLALTLWWFRDHPWRAAVLVLVGALLVTAVRIYGEQYLGFHG